MNRAALNKRFFAQIWFELRWVLVGLIWFMGYMFPILMISRPNSLGHAYWIAYLDICKRIAAIFKLDYVYIIFVSLFIPFFLFMVIFRFLVRKKGTSRLLKKSV